MPPRVALYSALYGEYDAVKPLPANLGVPAVMYTDNPDLDAPGWELRVVRHDRGAAAARASWNPELVAPMLEHKWWKTHPDEAVGDLANTSIWIDASMEIIVPDFVERCLSALGGDDWACVPHPARTCIYTEATFSAQLPRYDGRAIARQAAFYSDVVGHPANWGLFASGHNVRRHSSKVRRLGYQWWDDNVNWTHQDQLSLPVLMRLYAQNEGLTFNTRLPWHEWWALHPHQK